MKNALITGITGQDGAYLAKLLLDKGYNVYGTYRRLSSTNFWRLHYFGIYQKIKLLEADILDPFSIFTAIENSRPDEIYNFAAQSYVSVSFKEPYHTLMVTGLGPLNILESIIKINKKIKFYQASSSEMFGNSENKKKTENTHFSPSSPYAIAKTTAYHLTKMYRATYDLFATNGILFNHESPLRGLEFVTRKISNEVAKISLGISSKLELGNISAKRDWGYAEDYVLGIWQMMQQKQPNDFILSTGQSHSVQSFAELACEFAGISKNCIISRKQYLRPLDVQHLQGDFTKATKFLKWKPKISFKQLVKIMVDEDIRRWKLYMKGEYFPWDVTPNPMK